MTRSAEARPGADRPPEAVVLAGRRAGKALREVAAELYGRERVEAGWRSGGWMRAKVRRLLRRSGTGAGAGPGAA